VGYGKTISQPFIVALMTDLLELKPDDVTLEVGAGVAIRPRISRDWRSRLQHRAYRGARSRHPERLKNLGYRNIESRSATATTDGAEHAPFDKIVVTAAPD